MLEKLDVSVGFDLDFKGPPEGKGKYRTKPHLLGLTTPDGIFCDRARVEMHPDDCTVRLELLTAADVGEISVTLSLDSLEKIVAAAKKSLTAKTKITRWEKLWKEGLKKSKKTTKKTDVSK